ncbi:TRAP transporter substrate-binding protein [Stutzerimonas xanthomarina]|uniref:Tripartite ATP-independent transporter solute receptor, DctP family n=2 Tax=Stutzerimonas xanthomarina TaxID=271420 RepID=A0A1M5TIC9_9GAMM|nr:TRAP transporter substrate-binding protein [Stutzerimonas xanthomarina]MCP9340241.1 TRAP transporter substrate-binding protein [Stutzerimonas xanthomarina]SEH55106.1 tripartite ATP-independent transporter solute receptor, DctP family [Stutzerimonas xanthomarina]SHH50466.1 tripartite ATP-independent transporter solute receptor, DctP family [Stutzerimonas xanthomarina DSM 18231]
MKVSKKALLASVLALGVGMGVSAAHAADKQIKFGHVGGPGSLFEITANEFARIANETLEGYEVVPYGSSQLGSDSQMLNKLKLGTLDLALPSTVMSSVSPEFSLFEMPYLIKDREHMKKVRDEVVRSVMYPAAEKRNLNIIAVWENGSRQITNNSRPIVVPKDLEGLKLRTPNGIWRVEMFQGYGANPAPMALSEAFVALQTGAMDGQENPLVQIYSQRFHEVQRYLSMSNHVYTPAFVVAGASWKRLPDEVRTVLSDAAMELEDFALKQGEELDNSLVAKMKEAGMEVNEVDQQAFIDGSDAIYAKFSEEVDGGKEMLEKVRQLRD